MKLSPHFHDWEFKCRCCGRLGRHGISADLLERLEQLRSDLGNEPIMILSGYRCSRHNRIVSGAINSRHLRGKAADIVIRLWQPCTVATSAELGAFKDGGVGRYRHWTHVDVRKRRARWKG